MHLLWRQSLVPVILVATSIISAPALAIVGGEPPAEDDRRFDAVGAWSRTAWLGLGDNPQHEHNWFGGATLVRANLVVTAKHIADDIDSPSGTYAVRFRRRIDGGLGSRDQGPFSYHHVLVSRIVHGPGDLALAYLAEPVTHIQPISVMQMGFLGLEDSPYISAGWGQEGPGQQEGPRNQLLLCAQNTLSSIQLNRLTYPGFGSNPAPPCKVNRWDSGGAVLVEEQNRLWLLSAHQTYRSGPTLWPWLDEAQPQMLHTPFTEPDLAVEQVLVVGSSDVQRGEGADLNVMISNPGSRRVAPETGQLVIDVYAPGLRGDESTEVYRQLLPRNWQSRQRRNESVQIDLPATLPVGLYLANVSLSGMAETDIVRNNQIALDGVISIRSRRNPFERLRVGAVVRRMDEGILQLINLVYLERRHGRHALWAFGTNTVGDESFAVVDYDGPVGAASLDTPWGEVSVDFSRDEPLLAPEGFSGSISSVDQGQYAPFSGLYEGLGPQSEQVVLALAATGHVTGGLIQNDQTVVVNMQFQNLAYRVEAAENQTAFRALELSWNEERDAAVLVMVDGQGQRFVLQREEEPAALYDVCRNGLQCQAHSGDRQTQCYQATDQIFGVCSPIACADNPNRCGNSGRCLVDPDFCVPTCSAAEECPTGMMCTHDGVCVDCAAYPSLCAVPDAGPPADAGVMMDTMVADGAVGDSDAGTHTVDASMADAGVGEPSPGNGCSCSGSGWSGVLWALSLVLLRRRRVS